MNTQKSVHYFVSIIICMYLSISGMSGQDVFDIYAYKIPDGYMADKTDQSLILSSTDGKLSILLLPSRPCTDIAYTEFGKDWAQFVTSEYSVLGFPNRITSPFQDSWEMTTGQAKVFNDETTLWIQLRNFTREGKKATIIFFAVDDKQQEAIKDFINDLKLADAATNPELPSRLIPAETSGQNISEQQNDSESGVEIWMRIKMGAWNMSDGYYTGNYYDLSKNKMAYTVLFPDGTYTGNEIPRKGLIGFSNKAPEASDYSWGNYTRQGKTLAIKSDFEDLKLVYKTADVLENPSSSFLYYKCKKVDGLKLNGAWSYIPNSEDDHYYDEPGCRQVIYFKNDMTFDDRGVFVSDCRYPDRYPEEAPGKGTYSISSFTLILRYSDGRIVHKSFTGALMNDPFLNNDVIYIGGNNFFKRKGVQESASGEGNRDINPSAAPNGISKYDNFIYTMPQGWISKESGQFLELFPSRAVDKEIFSILLLKGKNSRASLQDELAITWTEFANLLGAQMLNQVSGSKYTTEEISKTFAGWEYISGHGSIRSNGDFFVHAYIIRVNDRIERVIVLAKEIVLDGLRNNIDPSVHHYPYFTTITDFIFNLGFDNFPSRELTKSSIKGTGVTGVWAGLGFMGGQLKTTYMIFFSNGQVYYGSRFPFTGIYELNTYADKERVPRYWGTYEFSGGSGTVTMTYGQFPIRIEGDNLIASPVSEEHKFVKIPSVDNLKLNGKWMIRDHNDHPVYITFRQDGSFSDEGALRVLDHSIYQYYSIADGGGAGTYMIRDYTINFNYADGRVLKIAFPGLEFDTSNPSPQEIVLSYNNDILVRQ